MAKGISSAFNANAPALEAELAFCPVLFGWWFNV
jgi:hypothetical protein